MDERHDSSLFQYKTVRGWVDRIVSKWWDECSMRPMGVVVQSDGSYGNVLCRPLRSTLSMMLVAARPGWSPLVHHHPCQSTSWAVRLVHSDVHLCCCRHFLRRRHCCCVSGRGFFWLCWRRLSSYFTCRPLVARIIILNTACSPTNRRLLCFGACVCSKRDCVAWLI